MKQRVTNRWIKERKDRKGRLLCLVPICNNLRAKYKTSNRTRNYCNKHNCWDMREFTSWQSLREKALRRDKHTCVKCGDKRQYTDVKRPYFGTISNHVVDHIKPIALGGDEWDIDNLQTLCYNCNKIKTKRDLKLINHARRKEKLLAKGQTQL